MSIRFKKIKGPKGCSAFFDTLLALDIVARRISVQTGRESLPSSRSEVQETRIRSSLLILIIGVLTCQQSLCIGKEGPIISKDI